MKRIGIASIIPLVLSCCAAFAAEFVFDGKDLSEWKVPEPNPFWRLEGGALVGENDASQKGSVLYTKKEYKDFVIEAEVRWNGEIDSGFLFRKPELQLQIGVSRSLKTDLTGSFYVGGKQDPYPQAGRAAEAAKLIKPGEWNKLKLEVRGDTAKTWINGTKASEYTDPKFKDAAPIGLQIHSKLPMKVEFRSIRIQEL
jgi:hypothetical protein